MGYQTMQLLIKRQAFLRVAMPSEMIKRPKVQRTTKTSWKSGLHPLA